MRTTSSIKSKDSPLIHKPHWSMFKQIPLIYYLIVLMVLLGLEEFVQAAPTIRLLESAICQQHYVTSDNEGPINEEICKIDKIQRRLAFIRGWQGFFNALPSQFAVIALLTLLATQING